MSEVVKATFAIGIPSRGVMETHLSFSSCDAHVCTCLGCHVGCFGNFHMPMPTLKTEHAYAFVAPQAEERVTIYNEVRAVLPPLIMTELCSVAARAPLPGCSHSKSHIIISANCHDVIPDTFKLYNTKGIMEIIEAFCAKDPVKYGTCVATEYTENRAHPYENDKNRTLVWVPPHVQRKAAPKVNFETQIPVPK